MVQQGEQMRVGEDFAYHSVKLVSRANSDMFVVDFNTFFGIFAQCQSQTIV
jgi:hypothetical protein